MDAQTHLALANRLCDKYHNRMGCGSNEILILMGRCFEKSKFKTRFSCKNIQDRVVYSSTLCKINGKKDRITSWGKNLDLKSSSALWPEKKIKWVARLFVYLLFF